MWSQLCGAEKCDEYNNTLNSKLLLKYYEAAGDYVCA